MNCREKCRNGCHCPEGHRAVCKNRLKTCPCACSGGKKKQERWKWIANHQGIIISSNGAKIIGHTDAELIGTSCLDLLAIEYLDDMPKVWSPESPGQTTFSAALKFKSSNGNTILTNSLSTAILHKEKDVVAYKTTTTRLEGDI